MGRAGTVAKNIKYTVMGELMLSLLKFVSRKAFVLFLGKEYLGISGLFTDILSVLSLTELGFGVAVTYSLYRPVAQGDGELIGSLMRLYRRFCLIAGGVMLTAGLSLTPFLEFFVREMPENVSDIPMIYVLNVVNSVIVCLFAHKSVLLYVYQRKYTEVLIRAAVTLCATAAQIGVLVLTGNYTHYMYLSVGAALLQEILISVKTNRLYPWLRRKDIRPLPAETLSDIRRNVRAMILHRAGAVAVFGTDSLLISKFAGVVNAGLYSNYILIRGFLNAMIRALFNALTPAMGNLSAAAAQEQRLSAFRRLNFFSAWLFGWMSICLFCLYDPFIRLWLGEGWLLPGTAVLLIVANFYASSMRIPVADVRSVMGLFRDDRFKSVAEALMNLTISVILAQKWGVTGILTGTLISTMTFPFLIEPYGLYRIGLKTSVKEYFYDYFVRLTVTVAAGALTAFLCGLTGDGIRGFFLKSMLCLAVPNGIYGAVYRRNPEFCFLRDEAGRLLRGLK